MQGQFKPEDFSQALQELHDDKPNEEGVRLQKKTMVIFIDDEAFTVTVERGDMLNSASQLQPVEEIKIGKVGVDSGELIILDPCYLDKPELGIRISGFGGDGRYPVSILKEKESGKLVRKIIIDLIAKPEV